MMRCRFVCLAWLGGCLPADGADPALSAEPSALVISHRGDGELALSAELSRYELRNADSRVAVRGALTTEDATEIRSLLTAELQGTYARSAAMDYAACVQAGGYALRGPKLADSCFVQADVSDMQTQTMLAFFVPMFRRYLAQSEE